MLDLDGFKQVNDTHGHNQAIGVAATLCGTVSSASISVGETNISVTASIGVEHLDHSVTSDQDALLQADTAMYRAKAKR